MGAASGVQLVRDGHPQAQIVIAEHPPRMVSLAAQELQEHLRKISGAELPIVNEPDASLPTLDLTVKPDHPLRQFTGAANAGRAGAPGMVSRPDRAVACTNQFGPKRSLPAGAPSVHRRPRPLSPQCMCREGSLSPEFRNLGQTCST